MTKPTPEKTKNTNRETTDEKRNEGSFPDPPPSRNTTPSRYSTNRESTPQAWPPKIPKLPLLGKTNGYRLQKKGNQKHQRKLQPPCPPKHRNRNNCVEPATFRELFFISAGISPECTAGHIEKYCAEREIRVSNCRILQTRRFGTRAARLSVAQIDAEKAEMLSENFWPEHISIRPWIFPEDGEIVERFESGGRRLRASNWWRPLRQWRLVAL